MEVPVVPGDSKGQVRDYFEREEDFSEWLCERGEGLLSNVLGFEVKTIETERSTEHGSVDIVASARFSDINILIENEFGRSDEDHGWRCLDYGRDLGADLIVWIAGEWRSRDLDVLSWLGPQIDPLFVAVKVETIEQEEQKPVVDLSVVEGASQIESADWDLPSDFDRQRIRAQETIDDTFKKHGYPTSDGKYTDYAGGLRNGNLFERDESWMYFRLYKYTNQYDGNIVARYVLNDIDAAEIKESLLNEFEEQIDDAWDSWCPEVERSGSRFRIVVSRNFDWSSNNYREIGNWCVDVYEWFDELNEEVLKEFDL